MKVSLEYSLFSYTYIKQQHSKNENLCIGIGTSTLFTFFNLNKKKSAFYSFFF